MKVSGSGEGGKNARSLKNLLLDPFTQIKLGLYSFLLALVFSLVVLGILYVNLNNFASIVMTLTDAEDELTGLFIQYMSDATLWLSVTIIAFLLLNILISIVYTHHLIGPAVAFRRHVQNLHKKEYSSRVHLRKGDSFVELANDLNSLAEKLEKNS